MKKITFLFSLLFSSLFFINSCKKSDTGVVPELVPVTIIKNCTGNYLRYEDKDYRICNGDVVNKLGDGMSAKAAFNVTTTCTNPKPEIVCAMAYLYEGVVIVTYIE